MSDKDFLNQFSGDNKKPDSFKEEERIPVVKEKKPFKPVYVIAPLAILAIILGVCYFLFWSPKIVMKNFVGLNKSEISSFVRQQGIDPTGIVFKEEYNFDYDRDIVIYQSIEPDKKIKNNAKIDFTISMGADPDELIRFPDIMNMTQDELNQWAKENKLQKTKITTSFNETVPAGEVISYDVKSDESAFTRGTTLNISVSKGPTPAGTVQIQDFVKKQYYEAESWAKQNKVEIVKNEAYSNTVDAGLIISQYPASGTMKTGEAFSVTVSKGKGISIPDFTKMSESELNSWMKRNSVTVDTSERRYSNSDRYIISQSPSAGSMISAGEPVSVVINQGNGFYLKDVGLSGMIGSQFNEVCDTLNNLRSSGIDTFAGSWSSPEGVYSYEYPKGSIVSVTITGYSNKKVYSPNDKLPLDARFDVVLSKGKMYDVDLSKADKGGGVYEIASLSDTLTAISFPFHVLASGDTCELNVNGMKITGSTITLVEGDHIELR